MTEKTWNEVKAEDLRTKAARLDRLAFAASSEGDSWDAAQCAAEAMELRREARRLEASVAESQS